MSELERLCRELPPLVLPPEELPPPPIIPYNDCNKLPDAPPDPGDPGGRNEPPEEDRLDDSRGPAAPDPGPGLAGGEWCSGCGTNA